MSKGYESSTFIRSSFELICTLVRGRGGASRNPELDRRISALQSSFASVMELVDADGKSRAPKNTNGTKFKSKGRKSSGSGEYAKTDKVILEKQRKKAPVSTTALEGALVTVENLNNSQGRNKTIDQYREDLPRRGRSGTDAQGVERELVRGGTSKRQEPIRMGSRISTNRTSQLPGAQGGCPLPGGLSKHVFISHCQGTGGDQAAMLHLELESLGLKVWYDQSDEDVTKEGMREGLEQSLVVLLFLSAGVLSR
jgi:hypothetical protein